MGSQKLKRASVPAVLLAVLGAGTLTAFALGKSIAADHAALTTVTPPSTSIPSPMINSMLTVSTGNAAVGTPVTLRTTVTDVNINQSNVIEQVDGFDPSSMTIQSAASDMGPCDPLASSRISCPLGTMTPGNLLNVQIVFVPTAPGAFQFTARAFPFGAPAPTATVTVTVTAATTTTAAATTTAATADLTVHVRAVKLKPKLGHDFRVGITVENDGTAAAAATASLKLAVPLQTRLVRASGPSGRCGGKPVVCGLGGIGAGTTDLVVVTLEAVKPGIGHLVATAGGHSGSVTISVARPPDHAR